MSINFHLDVRQSHLRFRFSILLAMFVASLGRGQVNADQIDIQLSTDRGTQQRVEAEFEHVGKVIVERSGEKQQLKELPMKTVAKFNYFQRLTGTEQAPQAIRFFDLAEGDFEIENGKSEVSLALNNRLIVARLKSVPGQRLQLASVVSTLEQPEYLLIKNPADPLTFAKLLNREQVAVGKKWKVDENALADFLNVDRILFSNAQLLLKTATQDKARLYMLGKVDASVDDVATAIKINAIFDLDLKNNMVTDVRVNIDQTRQAGQVAPGFTGKSKVDMRLSKNDSCRHLSTAMLKKYTKSRRIKQRLAWKSDTGRFSVEYDPRWRIITAEDEAAVLRFVDDGDLLAQCDVVQLPSRPAGNPLTLEAYKTEVQKIIQADGLAKIKTASKAKTPSGLTALKVIVTGLEADVPVQWIYYHVSADDGRRLTFVFTMEQEVAGVFQPADQRLVSGLSFVLPTAKAVNKDADKPVKKVAKKAAQPKR